MEISRNQQDLLIKKFRQNYDSLTTQIQQEILDLINEYVIASNESMKIPRTITKEIIPGVFEGFSNPQNIEIYDNIETLKINLYQLTDLNGVFGDDPKSVTDAQKIKFLQTLRTNR